MGKITRRAFLRDLGQGTLAVAVFGLAVAACADEGDSAGTSSTAGSTPTSAGEAESPTTTSATSPTSTTAGSPGELRWEQVSLGSVSAYLLVRGGEVAIVDTGNPGSEGAIEETLAAVGTSWDDVGHVILTHLHPDHIGSLGAVMEAAPAAAGYAGEPDIPQIPSPRPLTAVDDGSSVFGLEIIATPGHTAGSISVLDAGSGVLVAGDALRTADGSVIGAAPQFSQDMALANESVRKLAQLSFETVLVGHGAPVVGGADALVVELAAGL
ncbi:MAG: MBL fold metallo-hydrolase [Acidimicrobiia bacterium]|nr:MBL fold metallo-hydrolase [Acidimicrobiia bacterium]